MSSLPFVVKFWKSTRERRYVGDRELVRWLREGDANTSFFHRTANMRKRMNNIHSLVTEYGTLKDMDNLETYIHGHFRKLFGERKHIRQNPHEGHEVG